MEAHPLYTDSLNHILAIMTLVGSAVLTLLALYVVYIAMSGKKNKTLECIASFVLSLGFFASLSGMVMSLWYSEVIRYAPCDLCWYQRIFLYPQVFLFAYAWYRKDKAVLPYTLLLSAVGFIIATYHHFLQMGFDLMKPCSTAPFAVDCAKPSFIEFGFVSFPFMSLVLFGAIILLIVIARISSSKK